MRRFFNVQASLNPSDVLIIVKPILLFYNIYTFNPVYFISNMMQISLSPVKYITKTLPFKACICLFILTLVVAQAAAQTARNTILFNSGWKFHKGDVAAGDKITFNDKGWTAVTLPHDWSVEGPFSQEWASGTAFLPAGIGWYRKTFSMPSAAKDKHTYIYFDGVYKESEVWINGHYLGKRPNGFISFQYDLSPYLNNSGKNVLAVKVDHSQFADSRWYTGSGIYRNVYLITESPVHIGLWGVAFTTPKVSQKQAAVKVNVAVVNGASNNKGITVKCKLVDAAGKTVAAAGKSMSLKKGDSTTADLNFAISNPHLWSVDNPGLYNLVVTVSAGGKPADELNYKVGIRDIKFDADKGFFLNGKNMKLKGVCLHDDAGVLGVAVPKDVWRRRLIILKEGGCNSIRLSHNPHADYLYDLCDELGFLVMDEAFDEWEVGKNKWIKGWNAGTPGKDGYHEYFADWHDRDLGDMVLRDRNHASIIMWSIGNEIDYPNDPYSDTILNTGRNPQIYGKGYLPDHPPAKRLGELSGELAAVVKKYDTSRPVTAALAGVVMSNTTTFPENLDVVGYNYQEYRYKDDHKIYPKRVIYGSENGGQLSAWNAVDSNVYIAGQYLWTGIDYLGESHQWPLRGSFSGLLDLAGFTKPEYYFRKSLWSDKPMVYLATEESKPPTEKETGRRRSAAIPEWNYKPGDKVRVNCYTNCSEAELFLNGRSLGKKSLSQFDNRIIYWDVDYQAGELIVKANTNAGHLVSFALKTEGAASAIKTQVFQYATGPSALAQVEVDIVDKKGIPVFNADNDITVEIAGGAKLLGLENGDLNSHENNQSKTLKVFHGKLLAYIQLDNNPGKVSLTITSPGLKPQTVKISSFKSAGVKTPTPAIKKLM